MTYGSESSHHGFTETDHVFTTLVIASVIASFLVIGILALILAIFA